MRLQSTISESGRLGKFFSRAAATLTVAGTVALGSTLCGCGVASGFAMNTSGQGYYARGDYSSAAANFSRATLDDPSNPTYAYNLGRSLHKLGQTQQAEHQYRRALAIDPRHQPAYNGLASLMEQSGRSHEATALLQSWVTTQPHLPAAHIEMAAHQRRQGDLGGAESSLRQALTTDPGNTIALAQLGDVMQSAGRTGEAADMYRQSLARNPFQDDVSNRLTALARPADPVVQEASLAPAPQMIAGRSNPSFVPQMAAYQPMIPFGAPPYTTHRTAVTPWMPAQSNASGSVAAGSWSSAVPGSMIGGPIRAASFSQQSIAQAGMPQQAFSTPGLGMVASTSFGATSAGMPMPVPATSHVTYHSPTPAVQQPTLAATPAPSASATSSVIYGETLPPLSAPTLPAPELGAIQSTQLAPASHTTSGNTGQIQQLSFEEPPTVPSF